MEKQIIYRSEAEKRADELNEKMVDGFAKWLGSHWDTIVAVIEWYFIVAAVYLVVSVIVEIARKRFDGISGNIGEALLWPVSLVYRTKLDKAVVFVFKGKR